MRALDDQVRAGKILYVGVSDTPAWIVAQANTLARSGAGPRRRVAGGVQSDSARRGARAAANGARVWHGRNAVVAPSGRRPQWQI